VMKLLGEHNWYLPRWLGWLPQISLDGSAAGAVPAPRPGLDAEVRAETPRTRPGEGDDQRTGEERAAPR